MSSANQWGSRVQLNTKAIAAVLLAVVVIMGVTTVSAFVQSRRAAALEAELATTEAERTKLANNLKAAMTEVYWLRESAKAAALAQADRESGESADDDAPAKDEREDSSVQKKFAFVTKAYTQDGAVWLGLDYAEFLTDPDAIEKATSQTGDEFPPPNDYYVYNPSDQVREFRLADDATITIMLYGPEDAASLTPEEFATAFESNADQIADAGYWVTVEDGAITRLVEQWTP